MAGGGSSAKPAEDDDVDHYAVLGLPSGEEGASLPLKRIIKAYREQCLVLHPDKRPDDPNATANFQRLKDSFEVLKDEQSRAAYDARHQARLRARRERTQRDAAMDSKRRKLAADLDERERAAEAGEDLDAASRAKRREKDVAARLKEELAEFQARKVKRSAASPASTSTDSREKGEGSERIPLHKERMLKVSWEKTLGDYSAARLQELFERFGRVEDVVIRSNTSKKKGSAIVVMSSHDAAVAATHSMSGSLSNPLLVLPVQVASDVSAPSSAKHPAPVDPNLGNIVGAGFQDYEASILQKLQKANERRKNT